MKCIILSDIHSNLEALQEVIKKVDSIGYDKIICLGDVVGYGPFPNQCCQLLFERNPLLIIGNHDRAAINIEESRWFNRYAEQAAIWTYKNLNQRYKDLLNNLKPIKVINYLDGLNFVMVHGAISHADDYILSKDKAHYNITLLKSNFSDIHICFYGHTHIKKVWGFDNNNDYNFKIDIKNYYLINPGSVGQPRDRDTKASFIMFDTLSGEIKYHLVEYDIEKTVYAIKEAGLPSYLAERLLVGV